MGALKLNNFKFLLMYFSQVKDLVKLVGVWILKRKIVPKVVSRKFDECFLSKIHSTS